MTALRTLMTLLCVLVSPQLAQASDVTRPAGYVTSLDLRDETDKAKSSLTRNGQDIDLQVWTPLFDGDVISIVGASSLVIETARDKRLTLDAKNSPHTVAGSLTMSRQFVDIVGVIGDLFKSRSEKGSANLVGRSNRPPRPVIGTDGTQTVINGDMIWVAWTDGTPPFEVDVMGQTEQRKWNVDSLKKVTTDEYATAILVPKRAQGNLSLRIRDSNGLVGSIRMLTTTKGPERPDWLKQGAPTPEFATLADALWLLDQKPATWDLMAAGHLNALKPYRGAEEMLTRLAEGRRLER